MLQLKNITKNYVVGDSSVQALDGVSIQFRESEFVSILGPSGCGKTTLLNIIGGLDRYTDGDLIINGKSTKTFRDGDWDSYRNHRIGFVFQSYNLIPHQTVLSNVELALTLSGVSKEERRQRAIEVLKQVGLGDQLDKKPSQMSGGQMQRVAIARALVNNPDILLADEPTGALDTQTSIQIMEILKEISKDKLIIMVTHNPELAETYSTRIIKVLDGKVLSDSDPYEATEEAVIEAAPAPVEEKKEKKEKKKKKASEEKTSMSFFTALSLSFNNLKTKKGRTIMTSFAGSIGIIGIALILAVSTGINAFITDVQRDTLSSFPISIYAEEADLTAMINTITNATSEEEKKAHGTDAVYPNLVMAELMKSITSSDVKKNNLEPFKEFIEDTENNGLSGHVSAIQYSYDIKLNMYAKNKYGNWNDTNLESLFTSMMGGTSGSTSESTPSSLLDTSSMFAAYEVWTELLPGEKNSDGSYSSLVNDLVKEQYDVVEGKWPEAADEVILVLDKYNEITDITLFSLGLISKQDMIKTITMAMNGKENTELNLKESYDFDEIIGKNFKLLLNSDFYVRSNDGIWVDIREESISIDSMLNQALDVKIVGIVKPTEEATSSPISGTLAYTAALTEWAIEKTNSSDIAKAILDEANKNTDIFTGLPFVSDTKKLTDEEKVAFVLNEYLPTLTTAAQKAELYKNIISTPSEEYISMAFNTYKEQFFGTGFDALSSEEKRAKLAQLVVDNGLMQGIDLETAISLLSGYTDSELEIRAEGLVNGIIKEKYAEAELDKLNTEIYPLALADSLNDATNKEMFNQIYARIEAGILAATNNNKIAFIASSYSESTGLSIETYYAILMMKGDEEINEIFNSLVYDLSFEQYASVARVDSVLLNNRIAEKYDAYIEANKENADAMIFIYKNFVPSGESKSTYDDNLKRVGICDLDDPAAIHIYASTFEDKDYIASVITSYNDSQEIEENKISYTDYVAMLMSSITVIVNAISYVLIAFVSISLVVSSIMIGIITNISVLERTKEIGILRAIGASKKDVSRVFNAETLIVGFCAGLMGIIITVILCFPITAIIQALTKLTNIRATLPWLGAVLLIIISMALTLIAGIIPARSAAKKDPVVALRTE